MWTKSRKGGMIKETGFGFWKFIRFGASKMRKKHRITENKPYRNGKFRRNAERVCGLFGNRSDTHGSIARLSGNSMNRADEMRPRPKGLRFVLSQDRKSVV